MGDSFQPKVHRTGHGVYIILLGKATFIKFKYLNSVLQKFGDINYELIQEGVDTYSGKLAN